MEVNRKRLQEDEDFVYFPKKKNSIKEVQKLYPDGVSDKEIARCLVLSLKQVKKLFESALRKLRKNNLDN